MKKESLNLIFDQELRNMKIYTFRMGKQNKDYISLAIKLSSIKDKHKNALLKEYFDMYKMIYRIRSMVSYYWEFDKNSTDCIKDLYLHNETFQKMIKIMQRKFTNLFEGTNKDHVILELDQS